MWFAECLEVGVVVSVCAEWALPVLVVHLGCGLGAVRPFAVRVGREVRGACCLPCLVVAALVG